MSYQKMKGVKRIRGENGAASGFSDTSSEDEDARQFRMQCASVAIEDTREKHQHQQQHHYGSLIKGSSSSRSKAATKSTNAGLLGSEKITKALHEMVDGTLVFVSRPVPGHIHKEGHSNHNVHASTHCPDGLAIENRGMRVFKNGPRISRLVESATSQGRSVQRHAKIADPGIRLPARRMINHDAIFSGSIGKNGCSGVIVQGDSLFQELKQLQVMRRHDDDTSTLNDKESQHNTKAAKQKKMRKQQEGIVVETLRSKAALRHRKRALATAFR